MLIFNINNLKIVIILNINIMNNDILCALRTIIDVKNYETKISILKNKIYQLQHNFDNLINTYSPTNDFRKKKLFDLYITNNMINSNIINCGIKHCNNKISKNTEYYIIYDLDKPYFNIHKNYTFSIIPKKLICSKCNHLLIKNNISVNSVNDFTKTQWNNFINNDLLIHLNYNHNLELLQKDNQDLKKKNIELRNLVNLLIETKINSKIIFEIFKISNFYMDIDKPITELIDI